MGTNIYHKVCKKQIADRNHLSQDDGSVTGFSQISTDFSLH